jgi:hypothetical protein
MTTIISLSSDIKNLKKDIVNFKEVEKVINLNECTDYRFFSNIELLIYNGRIILYSCCYGKYKKKKYITHIYNRKAELIYKYNIDYN